MLGWGQGAIDKSTHVLFVCLLLLWRVGRAQAMVCTAEARDNFVDPSILTWGPGIDLRLSSLSCKKHLCAHLYPTLAVPPVACSRQGQWRPSSFS